MAAGLPAISGKWEDELILAVAPTGQYDETADGHCYWFDPAEGNTVRFAWDGVRGEPLEPIKQHDGQWFAWSPDDRHIAYYGNRIGRFVVGMDGNESTWDGITRSVPPTWNADGSRVAFGAFVRGAPRLIVDRAPYGEWRVGPVRPAWSQDGMRLAFTAENREVQAGARPSDYRQWIVLDGVDQPVPDGLDADVGMQFSPDGKHFFYGAITRSKGRDATVQLVIDGSPGPACQGIAFPKWAPDGSIVHTIKTAAGVSIGRNGEPAGRAFGLNIAPPALSVGGSRIGYVGLQSKRHLTVVVDGVETRDYAEVWGNVEFSTDGRHAACLVQRQKKGFLGPAGKWTLLLDGRELGEWDAVSSNTHFSPDGEHVAFAAKRGAEAVLVRDDTVVASGTLVTPPRFGATGRLAAVVANGEPGKPGTRFHVVSDGTVGPDVDSPAEIEPGAAFRFSPDGRHLVSVGRLQGGWRPIVDSSVGPAFGGVGKVRFEPGRVTFSAVAADGIHRLSFALD